ncbi:MAG TPA: hypothetical protein VFY21_04350 [Xanthobacteraceae bacterium]|nr:hypothetical protein [Xanthobacteraceae bacterium]
MSEGNSEADALVYAYRPRMIGSGNSFRLGSHSLEWNMGGYPGQMAYPMIAAIRLGYRPSNLGSPRFTAEVWPRSGAKVEIVSASYKSPVAMEDQGPAYRAFIRELHKRVGESGGDCRFEAGFAAWRWWPMVAISAAAAVTIAYLAIQTVAAGNVNPVLLVVGFAALFAWQMWPLIMRNRPERYDPRHIPDRVLP